MDLQRKQPHVHHTLCIAEVHCILHTPCVTDCCSNMLLGCRILQHCCCKLHLYIGCTVCVQALASGCNACFMVPVYQSPMFIPSANNKLPCTHAQPPHLHPPEHKSYDPLSASPACPAQQQTNSQQRTADLEQDSLKLLGRGAHIACNYRGCAEGSARHLGRSCGSSTNSKL